MNRGKAETKEPITKRPPPKITTIQVISKAKTGNHEY